MILQHNDVVPDLLQTAFAPQIDTGSNSMTGAGFTLLSGFVTASQNDPMGNITQPGTLKSLPSFTCHALFAIIHDGNQRMRMSMQVKLSKTSGLLSHSLDSLAGALALSSWT